MLRQRLRSGTAEGHRRLEEELNLERTDLNRESYVALLERFLGLYEPLEERLVPLLESCWPGFFRHRVKTGYLRDDLLRLGHSEASLELVPRAGVSRLPDVSTVGRALGVAYVLEGSTLGGKYLLRHFAATLGLHPENGARFFSSYGDEVDLRWREFCELLNHYGDRASNHEEVVSAAQQTFACMRDWLCVKEQVVYDAR